MEHICTLQWRHNQVKRDGSITHMQHLDLCAVTYIYIYTPTPKAVYDIDIYIIYIYTYIQYAKPKVYIILKIPKA